MPRRTYDDGYDDGYADAERAMDDEPGYCDRQHCDDYDCACTQPGALDDMRFTVSDYLRKLRMGYRLDVTLRDVLEEFERSLDD